MKRFPFISRLASGVAMMALALGAVSLVSCNEEDDDVNKTKPLTQLSTPTSPVAGTATESDLSFSWAAVEGAQNYAAQIRLDKFGDIVKETITERQTVTFTGLQDGTEYFFRVRANDAYNEKKNSNWTEWISSTTVAIDPQHEPLEVPKNPICDMTQTTANSLVFSWEVVDNAVNYTWQLTATDLEPQSGITESLTVTIPALQSGVTYTFVVKANPAEGSAYRSSSFSKGVKATTTAVLATPAELKSTLKMAEALAFSWKAVNNADSYEYELSEGSVIVASGRTGVTPMTTRAEGGVTATTTNTTASFAGLKRSTYYQFRIKAVPAEGSTGYAASPFTDYVIEKTLATDATPIATPVVTTNGITQVRATVAWTAISGAASYKYQFGATQAEAEASEPVAIEAVEGVLATEFTKKGLDAATTYVVRVMACANPDDATKGDSEYSAWVNITTLAKVNALTIETAEEFLECFDRVNPGAVVTLKSGSYVTNKTITLTSAISFVGESATNRPIINCKQFTIAPAAACALIKFENIEFSCYNVNAETGALDTSSYLGGYFIDNSGQAAAVESLVINNCIVANGFKSAFVRINRTNFGVTNMTITNNLVCVGGDDGGVIGANGKSYDVASWVIRNNTFEMGGIYGSTKTAQLIRLPNPTNAATCDVVIENNTFYNTKCITGKNLLEAAGGGNITLKKNIFTISQAAPWASNIGVTAGITSEDNFIYPTSSTLVGFTVEDPQITNYVFLQNYRPTNAAVVAAGAGDTRWLN